MWRITGFAALLALGALLTGCASGDPRLQGTWRSHRVSMPVEMVKVTKMQTVKVGKRGKKTKQVPKTVMVAKSKPSPPYLDLTLKYEGAHLTFEYPPSDGAGPGRISVGYKVVESDETSSTIELRDPASGEKARIRMVFDGPDRYWVKMTGGEGWKEYYQRIGKQD